MSASKFLQSVLGDDGAAALAKAAERAPVLDAVLVPRTIVAWLSSSIRLGYEGEIPGLSNSYISINKSEQPEAFNGAITVGEYVYPFDQSSLLHIAAAVGVALGINGQKLDPSLRGQDLSKLGKSIDLLVKAKLIAKSLAEKPVADVSPGKEIGGDALNHSFGYDHVLDQVQRLAGYSVRIDQAPDGSIEAKLYQGTPEASSLVGKFRGHFDKLTDTLTLEDAADIDPPHHGKGLGTCMQEALNAHAKHILGAREVKGASLKAPSPTTDETQTDAYKPADDPFPIFTASEKTDKPTIKREVKISKNEALRKCSECGGIQFHNHKFTGCVCFRGLAKSVRTTEGADGAYTVKFTGSDWDEDSITALVSILKG